MQLFRNLLILILLAGILSTQGCLAAAVGYTGYALSSSKDDASQKETDAKNLQTYNTYKMDMEKLNLDREKSGLKPQAIMSYADWKLAHNIPTPAPESKKAAAPQE